MSTYFGRLPGVHEIVSVSYRLEDLDQQEPPCGSVACAIGHGPRAGIAVPEGVYGWGEYAEAVFGFSAYGRRGSWCFDYQWWQVDNTAYGAAMRIDYLLKHGAVPENYLAQLQGAAPLSYKVDK